VHLWVCLSQHFQRQLIHKVNDLICGLIHWIIKIWIDCWEVVSLEGSSLAGESGFLGVCLWRVCFGSSSLCFRDYHEVVSIMFLPCHWLKSNEASQLWTETPETMSQKQSLKLFLSGIYFSYKPIYSSMLGVIT
jgi:hypothetical protein